MGGPHGVGTDPLGPLCPPPRRGAAMDPSLGAAAPPPTGELNYWGANEGRGGALTKALMSFLPPQMRIVPCPSGGSPSRNWGGPPGWGGCCGG